MSGARNLWRRCVKLTHMMPKAQSDYYYRYAKQNFINYDREDDPEHISFLVTRGHTHVDYIEQKYSLDKQTGTNWNATRADMAANTQKGQGAADAPDGQPGEAPAPSPPPVGEGRGGGVASLRGSNVSRQLMGIVVEADVLGNLVVCELSEKARGKLKCGQTLAIGDVLVKIDGASVRGFDPSALSVGKGAHSFEFGRRQPAGAVYFEVALEP